MNKEYLICELGYYKINLTLTSKDSKFLTLEFRQTSFFKKAFRVTELPIRVPIKSQTNFSFKTLKKKTDKDKTT